MRHLIVVSVGNSFPLVWREVVALRHLQKSIRRRAQGGRIRLCTQKGDLFHTSANQLLRLRRGLEAEVLPEAPEDETRRTCWGIVKKMVRDPDSAEVLVLLLEETLVQSLPSHLLLPPLEEVRQAAGWTFDFERETFEEIGP